MLQNLSPLSLSRIGLLSWSGCKVAVAVIVLHRRWRSLFSFERRAFRTTSNDEIFTLFIATITSFAPCVRFVQSLRLLPHPKRKQSFACVCPREPREPRLARTAELRERTVRVYEKKTFSSSWSCQTNKPCGLFWEIRSGPRKTRTFGWEATYKRFTFGPARLARTDHLRPDVYRSKRGGDLGT